MNTKRILSIFVFFVLLIACTSVAFASENIDDSQFSEYSDLDEVDSEFDDDSEFIDDYSELDDDDSDLVDDDLDEFDDILDDDSDLENSNFRYNPFDLNITLKAYNSKLGATPNSNDHSFHANESKDSKSKQIGYDQMTKSVLKSIYLPGENQNTIENQSNDDKNSSNDIEKSNKGGSKQSNNYLTILSIILVLILVIIACKKLY